MKQIIMVMLTVSACYGFVDQPVPFRLEKGYLIIAKCSIADLSNLTAIVDTGVTETVIDSAIVQRLNVPVSSDVATFITKESPVQSAIIPSLSFGPIRIDSLAAITTDLSSLTHQLGFRPDVLIGMDVLHRSSFTIDYKARLIKFQPITSLSHAAPLLAGGRFLIVEGFISGKRTRLQLDTGLRGVVIYRDQFRGHMPPQGEPLDAIMSGVAASYRVSSMDGQQLRVGNWNGYQLPLTVLDRGPQTFVEFDGLLGARMLTSHRLSLDFDHMMLYWD